jgi:hypothetical protein
MFRRSTAFASLLLLLTACSDKHPLAGHWNQELPGGAHGAHLHFDTKGDKVNVGLAPRADGTHDHVHGTYTFDAATGAITVKAKLLEGNPADAWSGKLHDGHLDLKAGEVNLHFHRGDKAAGH